MVQVRMFISALLTVALLPFGAALAQPEDAAGIEERARQWQERHNKGDVEGVAELYTEDAMVHTATGAVAEGREAIREEILAPIAPIEAGLTEISIEPLEIAILNDTAYIIGSYRFRSGEGEVAGEGFALAVLTSENGEWMIHRHIVNMVLAEMVPPGDVDDVEAINERRERLMALYELGDIEALLGFYSEDFVGYPPTGQVIEGRQGVREYAQAQMAAGIGPPSLEPTEIEVLNDTAYDMGSYSLSDDEGEIIAQGNYLVILKRIDGEWKLHRNISNVILPEMEPTAEEEGS